MTDKSDPARPRAPQPNTRKRKGKGPPANPLAQPQNRWQRFVRYVWDRKRG